MEATRILPDLQSSLLCEDVRQEANGNFILVGILGYIRVPKLPITAFKICAFNRWVAGLGEFVEEVRLLAPDQTTVLRKSQVKFQLKDAAHNATNVSFFTQVEFKEAGVYYIEALVDDVMKLRYPLPVIMVQQKQQPGQPGSQPQTPPRDSPGTESGSE